MQPESGLARLVSMDRVGPEGLRRLRGARVILFGVGAIGGWIAQLLVGLFRSVVLVDRGYVEPANIGAAQGFQEIDEGLPKSAARARALEPLNRECRIEAVHKDLDDLGFAELGEAALSFVALDSRRTRAKAAEIALRNGWPSVDCAVDGTGRHLIGRVSVYGPGGACYLCPRDAADLAEIRREAAAGCPAWSWGHAAAEAVPTISFPSLGAAVAGLAVTSGLRLFLGGGGDGQELLMDLDAGTFSVRNLRRNPRCLADHRPFALVPVLRGTVARTFRDAVGLVGEPATLTLLRPGVTCAIRCPDCLQERRPYRLLGAIGESEGTCACGAVMQPAAGLVLGRFGREQAEPFLDRTWDELGLPAADVVVAQGPKGEANLCLT